MRVGLIGNMNNNSNNLIRYLMDQGLDCELLFYANEAGHFVPEADNIDPPAYPSRILGWGGYLQLLTTPAALIRQDLGGFDFLIGSRLAPSYAVKAGLRLDIFMPTGGDIHMLPMFSGFIPRDLVKFLIYSRRQRKGIRQSRTVYWDRTNEETERKTAPLLAGLDRIEHAVPAIYYPDYQGANLERRMTHSEYLPRFLSARKDADIFLFHHVKHVWTRPAIAHYGRLHEKGNDQIIRGLRKFYDRMPDARLKIAMFEFGTDHANSRALARELDVDKHLAWFPQMARKELMMGISVADGVIGEVTRSWFSYGTILEAMAMAKPVIHHRDDTLYPNKRLYPMVHVQDSDTIADAFIRIARRQVDLAEMGRQSHQWLADYGIGEGIREIMARVEAKERSGGG